MNDKYIKEYGKLNRKASPMFIEPKGYVFVGSSRKRMNLSNMPSHDAIRKFGNKLANNLSYEFEMEKPDSRVILLTKKNKVRLVK
jgi:tRNA wybutosine-synthesizing protein 1